MIVHVVPNLPRPLDGVGAYAVTLATALAASGSALRHRFVVGDPTWTPWAPIPGIPASPLPARSAKAVCQQLQSGGAEPPAVLLHFVNYGFERRGCPRWLLRGLEQCHRDHGLRLVTMFHEVYATGPPWRSSFWLSPVQRRIAARVAALSDRIVTSSPRYAELVGGLLRGHGPQPVVLPVYSTIGEPDTVTPLSARPRRVAVFGSAGTRARAWSRHRRALAAACRILEAEEVVDVGPGLPRLPATVAGRPVRALGQLPAADVSEILAHSVAGVLSYPPHLVPKSTVFAAYCAHGVLPVCSWKRSSRRTGEAFEDLWWSPPSPGARTTATLDGLQVTADRARSWYREHDLSIQARLFGDLLETITGESRR